MRMAKSLVVLVLGTLLATAPALAQETVKVHSQWPEARRVALASAAAKALPDISVEWVTPEAADMLWGVPVRILMGLAGEDLLEAYTPTGAGYLRPSFRSPGLPMRWTGLTAAAPAICYNTIIGNQTFAMTEPSRWETLAGPDFRLAYDIGPQVQLTDLASLPAGREILDGWTAAMGPTMAARFVAALARNVAAVHTDAAEACRLVARGHSAAGIGVTADALKLAKEGAPLQIIVPTPVAYNMDGAALRKGASAAARRLADFAVTPEAMAVYAESSLIVSRPGTPGTIETVPPASVRDLESIDFASLAPFAAKLLDAWRAAAK